MRFHGVAELQLCGVGSLRGWPDRHVLPLRPSYAPKLNLRGVVAGAPPSQFPFLYNFLVTSPFDYYLLMVAGSYNSYYGNIRAPLSTRS